MTRKLLSKIGNAVIFVGSSLGFCLVLLALLFAGPMISGYYDDYASRRDFDPVAWQDSARVFSEEAPRLQMIDDLLHCHSLEEMTRPEVVGLLGQPKDTPYFHEYNLVYWLGPEGGPFGIDSKWLLLKLNSSDAVTEVRIATD